MIKSKTIEKYVEDLVIIWMNWIQLNNISVNPNESFKNRKKSSLKQEQLIKKRYEIIKQIDDIFQTKLKV
jgi:hypothetical protein